jgi:hypothetical protein
VGERGITSPPVWPLSVVAVVVGEYAHLRTSFRLKWHGHANRIQPCICLPCFSMAYSIVSIVTQILARGPRKGHRQPRLAPVCQCRFVRVILSLCVAIRLRIVIVVVQITRASPFGVSKTFAQHFPWCAIWRSLMAPF